MQYGWSRRTVLNAALAAPWLAASRAAAAADAAAELADLQAASGGDLGVYALDTGSGQAFGLNADRRFAMCSTFKPLLAAAVLQRVDAGRLQLTQMLPLGPPDMVSHSPVTSLHLAAGRIDIETLCAAIVEVSDNPAANVLLKQIGGPRGLTRFVRGLNDDTTRLDRYETELNSNIPGDRRDTTTAAAMVRTLRQILLGDALSETSRERLLGWLRNSRTGLQRLRAGVPADWRAGDKTGSGANGALNDVAVFHPPRRAPLLVACYMSGSSLAPARLNEVHARVGRLVARVL